MLVSWYSLIIYTLRRLAKTRETLQHFEFLAVLINVSLSPLILMSILKLITQRYFAIKSETRILEDNAFKAYDGCWLNDFNIGQELHSRLTTDGLGIILIFCGGDASPALTVRRPVCKVECYMLMRAAGRRTLVPFKVNH